MTRDPGRVVWLATLVLSLAAVLLLAAAPPAGAQITVPGPTTVLGPQEFVPSRPAPLTFTPVIGVFEEYNDNVFLNNANRRSDWITGFAPGFSLDMRSELYRLAVSYLFTAEVYARETQLNDPIARQSGVIDGTYRLAPGMTLSLVDYYVSDINTNVITTSGIATGRNRGWSNAVTPGFAWELDPVWTLRLSATYELQRFDTSLLLDSDIYRLRGGVERRFSPRLLGMAGYELGIFDFDRAPGAVAHTPWVGARYSITPTLIGSVSAGPTFVQQEDRDDRVTASARAEIRQDFKLGSVGFSYERAVGTAGGLGGTTDNDSLSAFVRTRDWIRGLSVEFVPRYTRVKSDDGAIDAHTWSLSLRSTYRVTTWMSLFFGYAFFQQRSDTAAAVGVDQNRVSFGAQFGYPLTFD